MSGCGAPAGGPQGPRSFGTSVEDGPLRHAAAAPGSAHAGKARAAAIAGGTAATQPERGCRRRRQVSRRYSSSRDRRMPSRRGPTRRRGGKCVGTTCAVSPSTSCLAQATALRHFPTASRRAARVRAVQADGRQKGRAGSDAVSRSCGGRALLRSGGVSPHECGRSVSDYAAAGPLGSAVCASAEEQASPAIKASIKTTNRPSEAAPCPFWRARSL